MEFEYVCLKGYCMGVDEKENVFLFKEKEDLKKLLREKARVVFDDTRVSQVEVRHVSLSGVGFDRVVNKLDPLYVFRRG